MSFILAFIMITCSSSLSRTRVLGLSAFVARLPYRTGLHRGNSQLFSSSLSSDDTDYDVIVIGGGHAGCDAAAASARTGAKTALVTQRLDTIGELSCNPSIGGIGKGHLVREVDALDGLIGKIADEAGVHFRVLNRRKGPAVRGPRGQMDRDLYKGAMQRILRNYENLHLVEASVQDLLLDERHVYTSGHPDKRKAIIRGVVVEKNETTKTTTSEITARSVVITTGTFLRGVLMLGHDRYSGGRHLRDSEEVEPPSVGLAQTLARFNFPLGRLKTGTPPRIDGKTIDWDILKKQPTENPAMPFSHLLQFKGEQPPNIEAGKTISCYQTSTNEETHKVVMANQHLLPIYDGMDGAGNGPRYCPSIFKKVQRFPDRDSHNCFLEPEGLNTDIVYPNGMSGPYPEEVQLKIMRTMKGLGAVEIVRPGYDVEYDFVNPQSLTHTLETEKISGLYLAGQICGTTGYEEAAAQGIIAGANAGRKAIGNDEKDFVIGRDEGYIGVLIDDLVTRGTNEPYRMFTSRAEYRISLRADNADLRLTRKGFEYGIVRDLDRIYALDTREYMIDNRLDKLRDFKLLVSEWSNRGGSNMGGSNVQSKGKQGHKKTAEEVLAMPHVTLKDVESIMIDIQQEENEKEERKSTKKGGEVGGNDAIVDTSNADINGIDLNDVMTPSSASVYDTVEAAVKYQSYVKRQHRDMESYRKAQGQRIPPDFLYDHAVLPALSKEEVEKLKNAKPKTFAEASQISGITPQSLVYIYHIIRKRNWAREKQDQTTTAGE